MDRGGRNSSITRPSNYSILNPQFAEIEKGSHLMTSATARQMTFLEALEAHAPKKPFVAPTVTFVDDKLPPPTHDQVYYWRELAGAITLRGTEGMPHDGWPAELHPSTPTLNALVERKVIVRRGRAWHLRHHWYARLQELRKRAVATPALRQMERPAPDLPTYLELKAFEALCLFLDAAPKCRARLPFATWADRIEGVDDVASVEGEVPVTLLKLMRRYRLVRHTASCEWALSPKWQERLQLLWRGHDTAKREYVPPELSPKFPRSLVAGIDTWHLNWLVEEALPAHLRERLDAWQQQAREDEEEVETDVVYDGAPLLMYRSGTRAESGGGVSWGYVLLNPSLRLLIRKAPLGGIIAQARLGSECLWRRTPRGALDELTLLMKRLWRGRPGRRARTGREEKVQGQWQVSQVHLCHDVTNVPLEPELLARVVSRSRTQAIYEAAQADIERAMHAEGSDLDYDLPLVVDWDAQYADDAPFSAFTLGDLGGFGDDAPSSTFETPVEERSSSLYRWGRRLSGITFSPGGAISFAIYHKRLEARLRGKVHMFPLWRAAGWDGEEEVTRFEARLRREALRELRLLLGGNSDSRPCLDDPYELLEHLPALFAAIVGRRDECPDAVNAAWIRVVTPREGDTNRSRWDTDPTWRVVQAPPFAAVPASARRLVRRTQRARDVEQLVRAQYGYLVSFVALQHEEGERWDVSRALGTLAKALVVESEKPKKDFGALVRERRKARGLVVEARAKALPEVPPRRRAEPSPVLTLLHAEAEGGWSGGAGDEARLRAKIAEFRVRQAHEALEEAEASAKCSADLEALERAYLREVATCRAAWDGVAALAPLAEYDVTLPDRRAPMP
jgi:hypothetical protein